MLHITVDARMIGSSGIGRYIENILKRIITEEDLMFHLLGRIDELEKYDFSKRDNVNLIRCEFPIYSIEEQVKLAYKIPRISTVFFAPHYNIPIFYRGRLIVTIHDVFHLAMPEFVYGIHKFMYAKLMFKRVAKRADKIICVSKFTAGELKKYTDVNEDKIKVIYNGVSENWFNITEKDVIHDKPYILYVGNIKPHKNLERVLYAFELIKNEIACDLVLVGKKEGFITGDDKVDLLMKNLSDRVMFTGFVSDIYLEQYIKQAKLLLFLSLYEGFGLPPLEAMACGCPVLLSKIPALSEIYGKHAMYCDPYNVEDIAKNIKKALDSPNEIVYKKEVDNKKYAKNFSWERNAEKVLKIIKSFK